MKNEAILSIAVVWSVTLWSAQAAAVATSSSSSSKLISTSVSRLPMSLSIIVADLEAQGCTEVTTACFLSSRSVTRRQQSKILQALVGGENMREDEAASAAVDDDDQSAGPPSFDSIKACGLASGLALCKPDANDVVATASACGGNIIFYADPIDLCREEGLFEQLAPVMEQLLTDSAAQKRSSSPDEVESRANHCSPTLVVIVEYGDLAQARAAFEQVAEFFIANLSASNADSSSSISSSSRRIAVLQDIFDRVEYVASPSQAINVLTAAEATKSSTSDVMDRIADGVSSRIWSLMRSSSSSRRFLSSPSPPSVSADDLAAARLWGPAARAQLEPTVQRVQRACSDSEGNLVLVPRFGALVDAAVQQALDALHQLPSTSAADAAPASSVRHLASSNYGKQIQANLLSELSAELGSLFDEQMDLLGQASFDDFRKNLSRLLVSPRLKSDMDAVVSQSVAAFGRAAQQLVAGRQAPLSAWQRPLVGPAARRFRTRLQDYCSERLRTAQASGQYRPLPRRGVTVGLHYLLPKPFGNDFRQEPWMVHATDGMVYVPKDKITDIAPDDVAAGDWRDKIVPSPVGNDMIYMQS